MSIKIENCKILYTEKEFTSNKPDSLGQVIPFTEFQIVLNSIPVFIKVKDKTASGILKLFGDEIK